MPISIRKKLSNAQTCVAQDRTVCQHRREGVTSRAPCARWSKFRRKKKEQRIGVRRSRSDHVPTSARGCYQKGALCMQISIRKKLSNAQTCVAQDRTVCQHR